LGISSDKNSSVEYIANDIDGYSIKLTETRVRIFNAWKNSNPTLSDDLYRELMETEVKSV